MIAARTLQADDYRELLELLESLSDDDWEQPSLCPGWSVLDVARHLASWDEVLVFGPAARYPVALVRYLLRRFPPIDREQVLAAMRRRRGDERRLFDRLAPGAQLAEFVIHQEDIRRPLDRRRDIPGERLRAALDGVAKLPGVGAKKRITGRTVRATDVDWSRGNGRIVVEGPAEELLLALAGRDVALRAQLHDG